MKSIVSVIALLLMLAPGCAARKAPEPVAADSGSTAASAEITANKDHYLPSARTKNVDRTFNPAVTQAVVGDVIKGDELTLSDGTQVRLIGVESPIAAVSQRVGEYYGRGGVDLVRKLVEFKPIRIEYDRQTHDRRGRLLGYVYTQDGTLLQEALLKEGHAFATPFPPNVRHRERFAEAQADGIAARRGMWGLSAEDFPVERKPDQFVIEGARVKRVINGDSIELDDGTVIRYIGMDARDSENRLVPGEVGYSELKANTEWVQGKELRIEYDVDMRDPHGRDLAWVFVDNKLVNAELVRQGEAIVAVFPPNVKYLSQLFEAQATAAKNAVGLWAADVAAPVAGDIE